MTAIQWTDGRFVVSTDRSLLDLDAIHGYLKTSYWASDRSRAQIEKTLAVSICFGMCDGSRQVGFARLVTDEVVISWLGDVFIIPEFQGNGLGKWLIECVVSHPSVKQTKCVLGTKDAHGLYEKYGFERKELMTRAKGEETDAVK